MEKTETKIMKNTPRYVDRKTTATVKFICSDLILLSKFLAFLKSTFKDNRDSKIIVDDERAYLVFINIPNECLAEALQEITLYGAGKP